jgi:hypothetical protein
VVRQGSSTDEPPGSYGSGITHESKAMAVFFPDWPGEALLETTKAGAWARQALWAAPWRERSGLFVRSSRGDAWAQWLELSADVVDALELR